MSNQNISQTGININKLDLNELKQMDYQRPAREVMLDNQETIKEIKNCWKCGENEPTKFFKIRMTQGSKFYEIPSENDEIVGICEKHLKEFNDNQSKKIRTYEITEWFSYFSYREIKKMSDEEFEAEKEELKKDIIKQLTFHGFLGYSPNPANKPIQHGIFRRLARKMKVANWSLGNKVEIEEWLTKASKNKNTNQLISDFWVKAEEYGELKALLESRVK